MHKFMGYIKGLFMYFFFLHELRGSVRGKIPNAMKNIPDFAPESNLYF